MTDGLPAIRALSEPSLDGPAPDPTLDPAPEPVSARSPLEVIVRTMRWWDRHADLLAAKLTATIIPLGDKAAFREATAIARELIAARGKALEAASLAAPFYHPRVGAIPPALAPGRRVPAPEVIPDDPVAACRTYLRLVQGIGDHNEP